MTRSPVSLSVEKLHSNVGLKMSLNEYSFLLIFESLYGIDHSEKINGLPLLSFIVNASPETIFLLKMNFKTVTYLLLKSCVKREIYSFSKILSRRSLHSSTLSSSKSIPYKLDITITPYFSYSGRLFLYFCFKTANFLFSTSTRKFPVPQAGSRNLESNLSVSFFTKSSIPFTSFSCVNTSPLFVTLCLDFI